MAVPILERIEEIIAQAAEPKPELKPATGANLRPQNPTVFIPKDIR